MGIGRIQKRNRYRSRVYFDRVANIIACHYNELKNKTCKGKHGNFMSRSFEDIFEDTIIHVVQDKSASVLSDKELLEYFCYKYKMIEYQTIMDSKQIIMLNANYIQAKAQADTEWE